ncbi:YcnI family copper-binding membrane protein [Clavibacter californiensis]|nr:YcnI family protein [Clavibacter californiensis]UKF81043.1 YcnI family protein [Clavibacter californiensis]
MTRSSTPAPRRRILRSATALVGGVALAVAVPLAASAHVRVSPDQAAAGSYSTLTFKVPTESATATTRSVTVDLPKDAPFSSLSTEPVPGWTAKVTTEKLGTPVKTDDATITDAPVEVTWTADDGVGIKAGEFQRFTVSVGPVPDTGSIMLPAHQAYSDGSVVDWDQATPASGEEPEHPAPTLYVDDAPPADSMSAMTTTAAPDATVTTAASDTSATSSAVAVGLGVGGLALGAVALVVAVFALTRVRREGGGQA